MKQKIAEFLLDEDGASTVDMTMLMAALVGLCLAVSATVAAGIEDLSGDTSSHMQGIEVGAAW